MLNVALLLSKIRATLIDPEVTQLYRQMMDETMGLSPQEAFNYTFKKLVLLGHNSKTAAKTAKAIRWTKTIIANCNHARTLDFTSPKVRKRCFPEL